MRTRDANQCCVISVFQMLYWVQWPRTSYALLCYYCEPMDATNQLMGSYVNGMMVTHLWVFCWSFSHSIPEPASYQILLDLVARA